MNAIFSIADLATSAQFTTSGTTTQPNQVSSTPEQIAKLDRWTVIAALSSVASALYLMFA